MNRHRLPRQSQIVLIIALIYCAFQLFRTYSIWEFEISLLNNSSSNSDPSPWMRNFRILHSPALNCNENSSIRSPIIVLVTSKPDHIELRSTIRRTWASIFNRLAFGVIFVSGQNQMTNDQQKQLMNEVDQYQDMLIMDFEDSYSNLSLKTLLAFKWMHSVIKGPNRYCNNRLTDTKFVLKVDDDVFLYAMNVLKFVNDHMEVRKTIYCNRFDRASVKRDASNSKRYVSYSSYAHRYYPNFCSGHAYLLTSDSLGPLIDHVQRLRTYVYLEDVLFTGLAAEAVGIQRVHDSRFQWWQYDRWILTDYKNAFTLHYVENPKAMERLYLESKK